jgi:hypothetical protein
VKRPNTHSAGYSTPTWSNTATYLRNLYSDFGYSGIFLVPFIFGMLSAYFWIAIFYRKKIRHVVYLTFILVAIGMSFFTLQSQTVLWTSIVGNIIIIRYIEKKYYSSIVKSNYVK